MHAELESADLEHLGGHLKQQRDTSRVVCRTGDAANVTPGRPARELRAPRATAGNLGRTRKQPPARRPHPQVRWKTSRASRTPVLCSRRIGSGRVCGTAASRQFLDMTIDTTGEVR